MKISAKAGSKVFDVLIDRQDGQYLVTVDGTEHLVDAQKLEADFYSILFEGRSYEVSVEADGEAYLVRHQAYEQKVELSDPSRRARDREKAAGPAKIISAMPGRIVRVLVAEGDEVAEGQGLLVVEAMKMENEVGSPKAGRVSSLQVDEGQAVESGALLAVVE